MTLHSFIEGATFQFKFGRGVKRVRASVISYNFSEPLNDTFSDTLVFRVKTRSSAGRLVRITSSNSDDFMEAAILVRSITLAVCVNA